MPPKTKQLTFREEIGRDYFGGNYDNAPPEVKEIINNILKTQTTIFPEQKGMIKIDIESILKNMDKRDIYKEKLNKWAVENKVDLKQPDPNYPGKTFEETAMDSLDTYKMDKKDFSESNPAFNIKPEEPKTADLRLPLNKNNLSDAILALPFVKEQPGDMIYVTNTELATLKKNFGTQSPDSLTQYDPIAQSLETIEKPLSTDKIEKKYGTLILKLEEALDDKDSTKIIDIQAKILKLNPEYQEDIDELLSLYEDEEVEEETDGPIRNFFKWIKGKIAEHNENISNSLK
mgnify:CR=1 FL=1